MITGAKNKNEFYAQLIRLYKETRFIMPWAHDKSDYSLSKKAKEVDKKSANKSEPFKQYLESKNNIML